MITVGFFIELRTSKLYNLDESNIGNLHLFEINDRLVWSFSEAETTVYMELDGKVTTNPFHHK